MVAYLGGPSEFGTGLARLATPWPDDVTVATGGLYGVRGADFVVAGGDVDWPPSTSRPRTWPVGPG